MRRLSVYTRHAQHPVLPQCLGYVVLERGSAVHLREGALARYVGTTGGGMDFQDGHAVREGPAGRGGLGCGCTGGGDCGSMPDSV